MIRARGGRGPDRAVNALDGGHLVGRYRIVKFLGAGAMGEVYLAEDPQIDRQLAIKTVRLVGRPAGDRGPQEAPAARGPRRRRGCSIPTW